MWQPTLVFLPGEPRGQRNLSGYRPWGVRYDVAAKPPPLLTCLERPLSGGLL